LAYDYSNDTPRERELIPSGTICTVVLHIRSGNAGEDGLLKRSKDGGCEMLDLEFTVVDGPHAKRKFWEYWVLDGIRSEHQDIARTSRGKLRQVLESSSGIKPNDMSPEARVARTVAIRDFEGKTFVVKIGIERGKDKNDGTGEKWSDKNYIDRIITPDQKDWHPSEQPPPFDDSGTAGAAPTSTPTSTPATTPAVPVAKPDWAA
jgi:hypothetical protein